MAEALDVGRGARTPCTPILLALALAAPIAFAGCSDVSAPTASVSGFVDLVDQFGDAVPDASGVTATLNSIGFAGTVLTGTDGSFHFDGLAPGEPFNLHFEKDGFVPLDVSAEKPGAGPIAARLLQRSTIHMVDLDASVQSCGEPCLDITFRATSFLTDPPHRRLLRLFIGAPGEATPASFDQAIVLVVAPDLPGLSVHGDTAVVHLTSIFPDFARFDPGAALDVAVYGGTENDPAVDARGDALATLSESHANASIAAPGGG